jgi:hypothetical protein
VTISAGAVRKLMKHTFLSFLILIAAGAAAPVMAAANTDADPWYQVDIIVFEHTGASAEAGLWQGELELPPLPAGAVPLMANAPLEAEQDDAAANPPPGTLIHQSGEAAFVRLEDERQQLTAVLNRLMVTPRYAPLFHASWLQPATSAADFAGVRLGLTGGDEEAIDADASDLLNQPLATAGTQSFAGADQPAIDGIVRLSRGRFLHLALDLRYRRSAEKAEHSLFNMFDREIERESLYRLSQSRRIRSGELHYFDHPRFGAIVLLTPYPAAENAGR